MGSRCSMARFDGPDPKSSSATTTPRSCRARRLASVDTDVAAEGSRMSSPSTEGATLVLVGELVTMSSRAGSAISDGATFTHTRNVGPARPRRDARSGPTRPGPAPTVPPARRVPPRRPGRAALGAARRRARAGSNPRSPTSPIATPGVQVDDVLVLEDEAVVVQRGTQVLAALGPHDDVLAHRRVEHLPRRAPFVLGPSHGKRRVPRSVSSVGASSASRPGRRDHHSDAGRQLELDLLRPCVGRLRSSRIRVAIWVASSADATYGHTSTNSSPANRATVSDFRRVSDSRAAASWRSSSPTL